MTAESEVFQRTDMTGKVFYHTEWTEWLDDNGNVYIKRFIKPVARPVSSLLKLTGKAWPFAVSAVVAGGAELIRRAYNNGSSFMKIVEEMRHQKGQLSAISGMKDIVSRSELYLKS